MSGDRDELKRQVNLRQADKPPVMPACRNCKHFTYDASDRMGVRGDFVEKVAKRCTLHKFPVRSNTVCNAHDFMHRDRRDL